MIYVSHAIFVYIITPVYILYIYIYILIYIYPDYV